MLGSTAPSALLAPPPALGAALRRWRLLNRVKQSAAAEVFGVSQTTISRWESGDARPDVRQLAKLTGFLTARPSTASDRALVSLVRDASASMHLICDLTHVLLAASRGRRAEWRVDEASLLGSSLRRFASEGIAAAETALAQSGWFESPAGEVVVRTETRAYPELTIPDGAMRYTRLLLSDGRFARLVRAEAA